MKPKQKQRNKVPAISFRDTIRALERAGFVRVRVNGDHVRLRKGETFVTVPDSIHSTMQKGTLTHIIKQANLTVEEFWNYL